MLIIGCDSFTCAISRSRWDTETGERWSGDRSTKTERRGAFYASLPKPVLVGMEATGYAMV